MAKTTAERTANLRAKRKADGWEYVHVAIPPEANRVLQAATGPGKQTKSEFIAQAILSQKS